MALDHLVYHHQIRLDLMLILDLTQILKKRLIMEKYFLQSKLPIDFAE